MTPSFHFSSPNLSLLSWLSSSVGFLGTLVILFLLLVMLIVLSLPGRSDNSDDFWLLWIACCWLARLILVFILVSQHLRTKADIIFHFVH